MNKTKIEWVKNPDGSQGYTWNPITGCLNHVNGLCKGGNFPCYAYRLANGRLKERYRANRNVPMSAPGQKTTTLEMCDPFYPRFWPERLGEPQSLGGGMFGLATIPKGIFVCDMGELFGNGIPHDWQAEIFDVILNNPWHRFYLLTKQPQNLPQFSPFPENCWVGVTACNAEMCYDAMDALYHIEANVKYVSFEPVLGRMNGGECDDTFRLDGMKEAGIKWVIIGATTGRELEMRGLAHKTGRMSIGSVMPFGNKWTLQPEIEWVQEIVRAADQAGVPVFLKDNLQPLFRGNEPNWLVGWENKPGELRQEFPSR